MTIRFRSSQIQDSTARHLKAALTALGWLDDPPRWTDTPFVWDPDFDPEAVDESDGPPARNTIGLSIGDIADNVINDLGGGLQSVNVPIFVDLYSEKRGISLNLSDDLQQVLQGELWSPSRYIPLYDHSQDPPVLNTDVALEARLVEARWGTGTQSWRRTWRIVSFTGTLYYVGAGND